MITDPFSPYYSDEDALELPSDVPPKTAPSNSKGKASALQQGSVIPEGWKPTLNKPVPVVRCTGTIRNGVNKGDRCGRWSLAGANVCLVHGGHLPNVKSHAQSVVDAARMRIIGLTDVAVDTLEELLSTSTQDAIKLKAATELLDRAGVKGGPDLTIVVEHTASAADAVKDRLKSIASRIESDKADPVDLGEIVDEPVVGDEGSETAPDA